MNKKGLTDFFVISRLDCIQLHFFLIYRYCLHFKIVKSVAGFWFLTLVSICERKIRQRKNTSSTPKQWSCRKWPKVTTNIRIDTKKIGNLSKGWKSLIGKNVDAVVLYYTRYFRVQSRAHVRISKLATIDNNFIFETYFLKALCWRTRKDLVISVEMKNFSTMMMRVHFFRIRLNVSSSKLFFSFPMIGFFLQEFELLFYNLSSARIFFRMDENEDEEEEDDLKSILG